MMIRRDAEFLCRATGGAIVLGQNVAFSTVSIDTRTMVPYLVNSARIIDDESTTMTTARLWAR